MMLMQGLGPTLTGYLWYGVTVYPGYELFKRLFIELAGPLNAALFRVPLVLAAGASATCFACIGVCPAEVGVASVDSRTRQAVPAVPQVWHWKRGGVFSSTACLVVFCWPCALF